MAYRNLTFHSRASDIRTETYLGEEHLVIPCIALVGDEVVYGMNADGPEFIPAEELELSTLGWGDRPVLYDHPPSSTSSACEPRTLEAMSFGRTFYPRFEDNKLKLEAWCNKRRAKEIGQEGLLESAQRGEMLELSIGAIISLVRQNGIAPNGKKFVGRWADIMSDHLAIGLSGSKGACSIEMGCGANRVLRAASTNVNESDGFRTMRAMRGAEDMDTNQETDQSTVASPETSTEPRKPGLIKKILSHASRIFRSNAEDEGLSDRDLRNRLWDLLYSIEPAFAGIEDVFQDSSTVRYITTPIVPERTMFMWRRTFAKGEDETVTVNDDRELVEEADPYYMLLASNGAGSGPEAIPCGCQSKSANETDSSIDPKGDDTMPDDKSKTETNPPPATPATGTPATEAPNTEPNPGAAPASTPPPTTPAAPAVTSEQLKALIEEHPVVKHYRAQEAKERETLVSTLVRKQKVLTEAQLNEKSLDDLRTIADLVGVSAQPVVGGDFSGRMMASAEDETEIKPVPKPWTAALKKAREQGAN